MGTDREPAWESAYGERLPAYERLASEIEFTLHARLDQEDLKIHSLTSRVKTIESIARKVERKDLDDPLEQLSDVVGVRIVALFLSDLPRLDELVRESFEIHASEDKVAGFDPSSFGYMSVHYDATLHDRHSGPRYDDLKGIRFEIQTRTIVMDAWANVSHHLDYKGSSSVPEELRKDFFALSGLFYVVDQHFEIFAARSHQSRRQAQEELRGEASEEVEINLDTMEAFLGERYGDRRRSDRAAISEFVEEVTGIGYSDIGALDEALRRAEPALIEYEERYPPVGGRHGKTRFANLGAARISLALADSDYAEDTSSIDRQIEEFALWA